MSSGLWTERGVPHKGWQMVRWFENADLQTCEMCQRAEIRYVFVMRHASWPEELEVGCVCAENMERERETDFRGIEARMKRLSARRHKFPDLKGWRATHKGNLMLTHRDGCRFVINRHPSHFTAMFQLDARDAVWLRKRYGNERAAKLAAFDAAVHAGWLK